MRKAISASMFLLLVALATSGGWAQELVWARTFGGAGDDYLEGGAVDADGNVYAVGYFQGTTDFDPGPSVHALTSVGEFDAYVLKLDRAGNYVWARSLGGARTEHALGVAVDGSGNVYTVGDFLETADFDPGAGTYELTSPGWTSAFISKLDPNGNFVWARHLGGYCTATAVALDGGGNVLTVGSFARTSDFDPGPGIYELTPHATTDDDAFVSKLDSAGNFAWAAQLGGWRRDLASSVAVDAAGDVYTVGIFTESGDFDPGPDATYLWAWFGSPYDTAFISRLDGAGNFVWAGALGTDRGTTANSVAVDAGGNVVTVGFFGGWGDFDPGPDYFMLTSSSGSAFISKLDGTNHLAWAEMSGGNPLRMAVDSGGSIVMAAHFHGTVDFDPGPATYDLTSSSSVDNTAVVKLTSAGSFLWAGKIGGTEYVHPNAVALDAHDSIYVMGWYTYTVDLDPGPGIDPRSSAGFRDAFLVKLRGCGSTFVDRSGYGTLLFPPTCTLDASAMTQDVYRSKSLAVSRGPNDSRFLSSDGETFAPLVVDDDLRVNGVNAGLGPYGYQPGVPPILLDVPIEEVLVPNPAHPITSLLPEGRSDVLFQLVDRERTICGNTAVYLLADCGIRLAKAPAMIHFVTHDDQVSGAPPRFDVRHGRLSQLRADRSFSRASCLGTFFDSPALDPLPDPPVGDGDYLLVRGWSSCVTQGYGDSSLTPDPRDQLDSLATCP